MRVLLTLLVLAALGLSVYNALEVRRLRSEVAALKASASARDSEAAGRQERARELLRSAEEHSARAQALIRKGDAEGARREMQKSMDLVSESARTAGESDLVQQIRDGAGNTLRRVEDLISRARKKEEAKPQPTPKPAR